MASKFLYSKESQVTASVAHETVDADDGALMDHIEVVLKLSISDPLDVQRIKSFVGSRDFYIEDIVEGRVNTRNKTIDVDLILCGGRPYTKKRVAQVKKERKEYEARMAKAVVKDDHARLKSLAKRLGFTLVKNTEK